MPRLNEQINQQWKQPSRGILRERCSEICSKFTGELPCQSETAVKLQSYFIEITLPPVELLHIFKTPFYKNTYRGMLLKQITHFFRGPLSVRV